MKEILLCKYGEIVLKGANRRYFEETLCKTMRFRAKHYGKFSISCSQSTMVIEPWMPTRIWRACLKLPPRCLVS